LNLDDHINITKKPEVIQMHLDILYKSVGFLSKHKIERILDEYKRAKDQKQREEEERLRIQMLLKKSRGRQAKNKCKLLEDSLQEHQSNVNQGNFHEGCHNGNHGNSSPRSNGDKYQQNGLNIIKSSCYMTEERRTTVLESAEGDLQNLQLNSQPLQTQQPLHNKHFQSLQSKDMNDQYDKKDMSISDYEPSQTMSLNSDRSKHSRAFAVLTRQLKRSRHSRAFRRIMRKLKNQKRLSRSIEKIFISKKEERNQNDFNQDPLLIKPKQEQFCSPTSAAAYNAQISMVQDNTVQPSINCNKDTNQ